MRINKGFAWIPVLLAFAIVMGLSGAAYWYSERQDKIDDNNPAVKMLQQEVHGQMDCASRHLPPDCNTDKKVNPNPTSNHDVSFQATPSVGPAPLTVKISSFDVCRFNTIDWGDETSWNSYSAQRTCEVQKSLFDSPEHTYTVPGIYTASLFSKGVVVGTIKITVSAQNTLPQVCIQNGYEFSVSEMASSDDKTVIAYFDGDDEVCAYNLKTGMGRVIIPGSAGEMALSRDGTKIYYNQYLSEGAAINGITPEQEAAAQLGWHSVDIASGTDTYLGTTTEPKKEELARPY